MLMRLSIEKTRGPLGRHFHEGAAPVIEDQERSLHPQVVSVEISHLAHEVPAHVRFEAPVLDDVNPFSEPEGVLDISVDHPVILRFTS